MMGTLVVKFSESTCIWMLYQLYKNPDEKANKVGHDQVPKCISNSKLKAKIEIVCAIGTSY